MRRILWNRSFPVLCAALLWSACGDDGTSSGEEDTGGDVTVADTSADTADVDAGEPDTDTPDTDTPDTDTPDTDTPDTDTPDTDTPDTDTPDGSGEPLPCAADQCDIDGVCFDNEAVNPDNPCEVCRVLTATDAWSFDDTNTCDDGDACTADDACFEGTCMGTIAICDSGNACTAGLCDPDTGDCVFENVDGACDDGDPCTVEDTCAAGVCSAGAPLDCDDGNPCTVERCEPGVGCVSEPLDGVACDDGEPCTVGDMCNAGACMPGTEPLDCDDGSLCTIDRCVPGAGCESVSIADRCGDDNPCTDELCDPLQGCVYPFNTDPCNDGSQCTAGDVCTEGVCRGAPVVVDDGNGCTDDTCDPLVGVINVPNMDACDDNNLCTIGDMCVEGGCEAGTDLLDCDDDNFCTANRCDPELGCVSENLTIACDDNNACTSGDTCGDGACDGIPIECDDGNACTADFCDPETGCGSTLIVSNECRPTIVVEFPPRAATLDSDDGPLVVTGTVTSGAGAITTFTINGETVEVGDDGAFSYSPSPEIGGNTLAFEAVDALGSTRKRVQSYLWSAAYQTPDPADVGTRSDPGVGIRLGAASFSTLGALFEALIASFDVGALLAAQPQPLFTQSGFDVFVLNENAIALGAATVAVAPRTGGLGLTANFAGLNATLGITGPFCNGTINYTASGLGLTADINLSVVNNAPVATFANVNATVSGGDLSVDCGIGFLVELIAGDLSGTIEGLLEDTVRSEFGPLISSAFEAFALNVDLPLPSFVPGAPPVTITLATDFSAINSSPTGTDFILRGGATVPESVVPYTNSGSLLRLGCGEGSQRMTFAGDQPLEVGLSDDLVNQILYSAWDGGFLEFPIPDELLGDFAIPGLEDLQLVASGMLQPTASDCANTEGPLSAQIGDLRIDASLTLFGQPLDLIVYVAIEAEVTVTAEAGEIGFGIGNLSNPQLEINVVQENLISAEATFESLLLTELIPALETALGGGGTLGSFPLPEIDLSGAIGTTEPLILRITPSEVIRSGGNTVILGVLE